MLAKLFIVQLGLGGVGQSLLQQYLNVADRYPWLHYRAIADRSGLCYFPDGWTTDALNEALQAKKRGSTLAKLAARLPGAEFVPAEGGIPSLDTLFHDQNGVGSVLVDVTAERGSYAATLQAKEAGAHVVLCNKWALAEPQELFDALMSAGTGKLLYETTVGAALPVIVTLDRLLGSDDKITAIEAAISGTLGFVSTEIENGTPFSEALKCAQSLGFTEPDPRDDLAGIDARRKALILARKLGMRLDMADVEVETLVPLGLENVSLDEFWLRLPEVDASYKERVEMAAARGGVLRFLARIDESGAKVSLQEVPKGSIAGSLVGTESLFVFHTEM
ncbi:MAG: homoserine dehydrogenase, partial [Chloroflexia bacterium]